MTLWRCQRGSITAGFVEDHGRILACAPILRRWYHGSATFHLLQALRRARFTVKKISL